MIRKIEVKTVSTKGNKWEWRHTAETTFEGAINQAKAETEKDLAIYGIKISRLEKGWIEEFSGNRNFDYIGINL